MIELNKILDLSLDIICTIDIEGRFVTVSKASILIWGYSPTDLVGRKYIDHVYHEDFELTNQIAEEIMNGVNITNFENRYVRKDGKIVPMIWSAHWDDEEKIMYCIARDGTEKQMAESRLLLSEKRFKNLVENSSDLIAILDMEATYTYVSSSSFAILGRKPDEYIDKNAFQFVHTDDKERTLSFFKRLENEKQVKIPPFRFLHKDGSWRWIETIATNFLEDDTVVGIVCNSRDVTVNIEASLLLEESNIRYKYVTKATYNAIWDWDLINNTLYWGDNFSDLFGYHLSSEETNISTWTDHLHPDDKDMVMRSIERCIEGVETKWLEEYRFEKWDHAYAYVVDRGFVIRDKKGTAVRMIGAMHDITERKNQERHLKLLESAINNSTDAIIITEAYPLDEPGPKIIYINDAFTRMTGYTTDEVIGKNPRMFQGDNSDMLVLKKLSNAIRNTQPCEVTVINYKKNGDQYDINFSVNPVKDEMGTVTHFVSIQRDVTSKILEQKQLQIFANDVYKQNRELQQFGYVVSHNLRSPVANIMGLVNLLEMDYEDIETVKKCTNDLHDSIHRLDHVIKDLSMILSITDGSAELTKENLDLTELILSVKDDLMEAIKKTEASIEIPSEFFKIYSHKAYLYSIFYNLLSNALKYKSDKKPLIRIEIQSEAESLIITVSDNGIGIDLEKNINDIFKPYKRFTTDIKGKGLGLFLVKSHVEALNGEISIESQLGIGTKIAIILPIK